MTASAGSAIYGAWGRLLFGGAIGPVVGGLLIARFWWGAAFLAPIPIMALLLIVGPTLLPEHRARRPVALMSPACRRNQLDRTDACRRSRNSNCDHSDRLVWNDDAVGAVLTPPRNPAPCRLLHRLWILHSRERDHEGAQGRWLGCASCAGRAPYDRGNTCRTATCRDRPL